MTGKVLDERTLPVAKLKGWLRQGVAPAEIAERVGCSGDAVLRYIRDVAPDELHEMTERTLQDLRDKMDEREVAEGRPVSEIRAELRRARDMVLAERRQRLDEAVATVSKMIETSADFDKAVARVATMFEAEAERLGGADGDPDTAGGVDAAWPRYRPDGVVVWDPATSTWERQDLLDNGDLDDRDLDEITMHLDEVLDEVAAASSAGNPLQDGQRVVMAAGQVVEYDPRTSAWSLLGTPDDAPAVKCALDERQAAAAQWRAFVGDPDMIDAIGDGQVVQILAREVPPAYIRTDADRREHLRQIAIGTVAVDRGRRVRRVLRRAFADAGVPVLGRGALRVARILARVERWAFDLEVLEVGHDGQE